MMLDHLNRGLTSMVKLDIPMLLMMEIRKCEFSSGHVFVIRKAVNIHDIYVDIQYYLTNASETLLAILIL